MGAILAPTPPPPPTLSFSLCPLLSCGCRQPTTDSLPRTKQCKLFGVKAGLGYAYIYMRSVLLQQILCCLTNLSTQKKFTYHNNLPHFCDNLLKCPAAQVSDTLPEWQTKQVLQISHGPEHSAVLACLERDGSGWHSHGINQLHLLGIELHTRGLVDAALTLPLWLHNFDFLRRKGHQLEVIFAHVVAIDAPLIGDHVCRELHFRLAKIIQNVVVSFLSFVSRLRDEKAREYIVPFHTKKELHPQMFEPTSLFAHLIGVPVEEPAQTRPVRTTGTPCPHSCTEPNAPHPNYLIFISISHTCTMMYPCICWLYVTHAKICYHVRTMPLPEIERRGGGGGSFYGPYGRSLQSSFW